MSNIFGGNTGMSYDEIQRKRAIAEAMVAQNANTPRNVGEGLSAIGRAIAGRAIERRTARHEKDNKAKADEMWSSVFGSMPSASPQQSYGAPVPSVSTRTEEDVIGDDAMAALGKPPVVSASERDMLARTIQAEAGNQGADGMRAVGAVIDNRRKANDYGQTYEDVIMAPGQFSAWNSQTGYAGGEQGQNMAFQPGPEAYAAADEILSGEYTDPTGGATHYFNPDISQPKWAQGAEFNRIGDHVFGSVTAPGSGGRAGVRGGSARQVASDVNNMQAIAEAMGNPYIQQDKGKMAILNALLQKQITPPATMTPYQQAQLDMKNKEMEMRAAGDWGSGTNVTVNNGGEAVKPLGTKGDILIRDENAPSGYRVEQAEGSTAARDAKAAENASAEAKAKAGDTITLIDSVLTDPALASVVGNVQGRLPAGIPGITGGQAGMDVSVKMRQIGGKAFLEAFEGLKGGGQITEREGQAAKDAMARLETAQSEEAYREALTELRTIAERGMRRAGGEVLADDYGSKASATHRFNPESGEIEVIQ